MRTTTKYLVNRQNGFYDEEPRVEIAIGLDEASPGMLVAQFEEEGEYDSALEAAEAALALATKTGGWPITVSAAASLGVYPSADDSKDEWELREWAQRRTALDDEREEDEFDAWDGMTIEEDE